MGEVSVRVTGADPVFDRFVGVFVVGRFFLDGCQVFREDGAVFSVCDLDLWGLGHDTKQLCVFGLEFFYEFKLVLHHCGL